jgi:hypothetical protein
MPVSPLVIVGCTDRKSLPVHPQLALRRLPKQLTIDEAAARWIDRYKVRSQAANSVKLRHLYQGEYWKVALGVESKFDTLVASAGIGIHGLDDIGIGYTATFTQGVEDSVLRFVGKSLQDVRQEWWRSINSKGALGSSNWLSKYAPKRGRRTVLVAVSQGYQQALSKDLSAIANNWANVVVVSGSRPLDVLVQHSNIHHIQVGQELRMVLGGSTPCVGVRFVHDFLASDVGSDVELAHAHLNRLNRRYQKLSPERKLPEISRIPFSDDDEVIQWITATIAHHKMTKPTKSFMLRLLRDEGRACEQKRFGTLFEIAIKQAQSPKKSIQKSR